MSKPNIRIILLAIAAGILAGMSSLYAQDFARETITAEAITAYSVATADFDGDGDLDIAVSGMSSYIVYWIQNRPGGYSTYPIYTSSAGQLKGITAGDFDGDGDADIVVAAYHEGRFILFRNTGTGTENRFEASTLFGSATGAYTVNTGDADDDGDLDLVVTQYTGNVVQVLLQSNGIFVQAAAFSVTRPVEAVFGDYDNDGDMDVLGGLDYDDMFMLHHDEGGPWTLIPLGDFHNQSGLAAADLDRDGDQDIAAALYNSGQIVWYEHTTNGLVMHALSTFMNQARDVGIADFNGDFRPDIIATAQNGNIHWWRNEGNRNFTELTLTSGSSLYGLNIVDFDRDGDLDVFAADWVASEVILYRNLMGVPGWITGTVVSATGHMPIPGVMIRLTETGASRFTDIHGRFTIATLPDTYHVNASHACWNESIQPDVAVVIGDTTTANFFLTRPQLELGVSSINLMAPNHQLTETTLPVENSGDGPLRITVKTRGAYANDDWLTVTPDSVDIPAGTGAAFSVQIRPDTTSTAGWDYYGQIILTTNACPDSVVTVGVGVYVFPLDAPEPHSPVPKRTALHPVYPNPFNSSAVVRFDLSAAARVDLKILDITGRLVREIARGFTAAGRHTARIEADGLASGVYVLSLQTDTQTFSEKILLIR